MARATIARWWLLIGVVLWFSPIRSALADQTENFSSGTQDGPWPPQWTSTSYLAMSTVVTAPPAALSGSGLVGRIGGPSGGQSNQHLAEATPALDSDQAVDIAGSTSTVKAVVLARRSAPDTYYGCLVGTSDRLRFFKGTPTNAYDPFPPIALPTPPAGVSLLSTTAWRRLRFKVTETPTGTLLQAKLWQGPQQPDGWTLEWTDTSSHVVRNTPGQSGIGVSGMSATKYVYFDNYRLTDENSPNCAGEADCSGGDACWPMSGRHFNKHAAQGICAPPICQTPTGGVCGSVADDCGQCSGYPRPCTADSDCVLGEMCGASNGPLFDQPLSARFCWEVACEDATAPPAWCGGPELPCGDCDCGIECERKACGESPANSCGSVCSELCNRPTLADLLEDFPPLHYREVTYARDPTDYFNLPTSTPLPTVPLSPLLRRENRFIFVVPTTRPVTLTTTFTNDSVAVNRQVDFKAYNAAGTVILRKTLTPDPSTGQLPTSVSLGTLTAGNYEFTIEPRNDVLTYKVSADLGVSVALKNGADLAEPNSSVYFYVPAEVETAFLLGEFEPGSPIQFSYLAPDQDPVAVTPNLITNKIYSIDTRGKPGLWRTSYQTKSSPAHFLNLPDVFSFHPDVVVTSKRIRTAMESSTGGASTSITSPNLRYNNRFAFHLAEPSAPTFTVGAGISSNPPAPIVVRILSSTGAQLASSNLTSSGGYQVTAGQLAAGDYELHVTNPSLSNSYSVTVPPHIPFVSVDGYGLGNIWLSTYRAYFNVPPGTTSVRFAANPTGVPITVYNPAGAAVPGQPTSPNNNTNNVYEIATPTPGIWSINLKGNYWSDIRLLNVPQIISFDPAHLTTVGPGGGLFCETDADCTGDDVCGIGNGAYFGLDPALNLCWPEICEHTPTASGCGIVPPPCGETGTCQQGDPCSETSDCQSGLACGTNNGGCFGGARQQTVCWPLQCEDGVAPDECGEANSPCGQNCSCAVACDCSSTAPVCPTGETCGCGLGQLFGSGSADVCITEGVCPSNDPNLCGHESSLCGKECVCTPDCSTATAAAPDDHCGGECPHLCLDGQQCCTQDVHCAAGSTCLADSNGNGVCRPASCAFLHLEPPLCGHAGAVCGDECPACTPDCAGRECGSDPICGTSCGSCDDGEYCAASLGGCVPTIDPYPPLLIPDGQGGEEPLEELPPSSTTPVGALPAEFSVSDQGTAQYRVPIQIPPGRAGMEPVLALRYSGSRVNGDLGVGWSLEGLSQITRCPRIHALDGYAAPIKNDPTDPFCFDGRRLEAVGGGVYGHDGTEYRTSVDSFTKVVSYTDGGGGLQWSAHGVTLVDRPNQGPDYFKAWMKDGRILTFGRTLDSLISGRDGVRYAWMLNRVEDRSGNTYVLVYNNIAATTPSAITNGFPNVFHLEKIAYTGHGDTPGDREVRFDYEPRPDKQLKFVQGGTPIYTITRLKSVSTFVGATAVRTYSIEYGPSKASLISSIAECAGGGSVPLACKPKTYFGYEQDVGFEEGIGDQNLGGQLDANGDGIPDYLSTQINIGGVKANGTLQAVSIGLDVGVAVASDAIPGGFAINLTWSMARGLLWGWLAEDPKITYTNLLQFGTGQRASPGSTVTAHGIACNGSPSSLLDYDQDGKDDVASLCTSNDLRIMRSLGDGHFSSDAPVLTLPYAFTRDGATPPGILYDLDGDGLQDLVTCRTTRLLEARLRLAPPAAFAPLPIELSDDQPLPFCESAVPTYRILDIDGDGAPELLTKYQGGGFLEGGWKVLRFKRGSSGTAYLAFESVAFPDLGDSSTGRGMLLGDLNGDGLVDVWRPRAGEVPGETRADGPVATIWLNTGHNKFLIRNPPHPRPIFDHDPRFELKSTALLDYDADGRADLIEHWATAQGARGNVVLTPNGWLSELIPTHPVPDLEFHYPDGHVGSGVFDSVGDIDGDGNPDLVGPSQIFYGSGQKNMLLTSVVDGVGKRIDIEYDHSDTYEADCSEALQWPEKCLPRMRGLVASHTEGLATRGPDHWFTYHYVNARMNMTGHGWLGFERRSVTEVTNAGTRTMTTEFSPPERYAPGGTLVTGAAWPYLYPLAGLPRHVVLDQAGTDIQPLEDGQRTRRNEVWNNWHVRVSEDGRPFPSLGHITTSSYSRPLDAAPDDNGLLRTTCEQNNLDVDGYGNVRYTSGNCQHISEGSPVESNATTTIFDPPSRDNWVVSNPNSVTTRSSRGGEQQTQVFTLGYDQGLLQSVTRDPPPPPPAPPQPQGDVQRVEFHRDSYGNIDQVTEEVAIDEPARVTQVVYSNDGYFPTDTYDTVGRTQTRFDPRSGRLTTHVDPNGVATQLAYDGLGMLRKLSGPMGTSVLSYAQIHEGIGPTDPVLEVTTVTTGIFGTSGGTQVQRYDSYGRLIRTKTSGFDGSQVITEQAYDGRGRLVEVTAPHLEGAPVIPSTVFGYDYLDRVVRVDHAQTTGTAAPVVVASSERQYASAVSAKSSLQPLVALAECGPYTPTLACAVDIELSIDEEGKKDTVVRDHLGSVVLSVDGKNTESLDYVSRYTYGAFNRLRTLRDNGNALTEFEYDAYGRLTAHIDPDIGRTSNTYNGFGELKTSIDPKGHLSTYYYDTLGRLTAIDDTADGISTWEYDNGVNAKGQLVRMTSPPTSENPAGQEVHYAYEPTTVVYHRALPMKVTHVIDGVSYDVGFGYDDLGRPQTITYPDMDSGTIVQAKYHYDPSSNALVEVTQPLGGGAERSLYRVDLAFEGHLVAQETYGNGATTNFGYDADRRWLKSRRTTLGEATLQDLTYTHYDNGQLFEIADPNATQEMTYDELGRLWTVTTGSAAPKSYDYDVFGNIIKQGSRYSSYHYFEGTPHHLDLVGSNSYQYDLNGNVSRRAGPEIPGGEQLFEYTSFNLPSRITTGAGSAQRITQFDYTADGQRVVRRDLEGSRHFVGDLYQRLQSPVGATLEERFRIAAGGRTVAEIVRKPGSEATLYFHEDHVGTPETISDQLGASFHQAHDAFGAPLAEAPQINQDFTRTGFTGHQHDNDLGLIDMRGRTYDPLAARFMSPDPIMQAPFWSQGLNRYSYVFNDPVNATDPSGYTTSSIARASMPEQLLWFGIAGGSLSGIGYALISGGAAAAVSTEAGVSSGVAAASSSGVAAASSSGAAAASGPSGLGAASTGLTYLSGAVNVAMDLVNSPFAAKPSASYTIASPSSAPKATPARQPGIAPTTSSNRAPGPALAQGAGRGVGRVAWRAMNAIKGLWKVKPVGRVLGFDELLRALQAGEDVIVDTKSTAEKLARTLGPGKRPVLDMPSAKQLRKGFKPHYHFYDEAGNRMPQHIWFSVPIAPLSFTEGVIEFWEEWVLPLDFSGIVDDRPVASPVK